MARLELGFLGPFQVVLDGQPVNAFESNKVRALLAFLFTEANRPQPRERLAELLWPDWPQQSAMRNLRNALADLRKNIGDRQAQPPCLLINRESLQINLEADLSVDVHTIDAALNAPQSSVHNPQSTISNLQSSISLYRGPFLEGFSLTDNPSFEEWLLGKREFFNQQMLKALNRLAEWGLEQGAYEQAEGYSRRQIELEPWREQAHQQLMRALNLKGERVQALAQFESLRKTLQRELKVEPSETTLELYQQIRDAGPEDKKKARGATESFSTLPDILPIEKQILGREYQLPTGTVTFLFTDIQGSTPLWEREPEKMAVALQVHNTVLRQAIEAHGGVIFKIVGDAFQAAFATAPQALQAAITGQQALQSATWNELGLLQVRMGLHTGEAELDPRGDDYAVSHTMNRIGRIRSVASGGQIVLSQETADLVVRKLPNGVSLEDLGEHRLKGMQWLEHLFQVCTPGLKQDFPALVTAVPQPPSKPAQRISFIDREKESPPSGTPLDHVVRGRMVGRTRELAEALQAWHKAKAGETGILLVSGEPGVGKTRLARELVVQAQAEGGLALVGECYAEGNAPNAVFAQMILDTADWPADLPQLVLADLINLAPGLRVRCPDVPLNPPLEPMAEQQRLYESAFTFFARLAKRQPLLLVLEDMHWADGGTLGLARSLTRRFYQTHTPVLLVLTFREGELTEHKGLNDLLTSWNRDRLTNPLKLRRLDQQVTQEQLETLFAEEVNADFAESVYHETEGNPFFTEELCKALIDGGQVYRQDGRWQWQSAIPIEMPRSIRMAIATRLANLPEACQEVLHLAAVLGRRFEFNVLLAAADPSLKQDEDTLIDALEVAEQAQLLFEIGHQGGGAFEFAHALIPTTLVEGLSGMRRRRLHRWAVAALEKLHPEDYKTLAHHCLEASEEPRALDYLVKAAQQARAAFANTEAVANYQQALGLLKDLHHEHGKEDEWRAAALPLYEGMGDVLELIGQHEEAHAAYLQALALVPENDYLHKSCLYRQLGKTRMIQRIFEDADQAFEQAETSLSQAPAERSQEWWREWVNIQLDRIGFFYWSGRVQKMPRLADEVRPAVEQYGTPLQRAKFYDGLNLMAVRKECYILSDETLQLALQSVSAGEQSGDLAEITWNNFQLGFSYLWHGDLEAAEKQLHKALALAERIGDVITQSRILTYLTITYRKLGDVQKVRQYAPRSLEVSTIGQMIPYASIAQANLAWAERREGNLDQAQGLVEAAWEVYKTAIISETFAWVMAWPLVAIYLTQQRLPDAIEFSRKLVAPTAQPQPEPIAVHLQAAILAWEQGQAEQAFASLKQAAILAEPLGYI